MSARFPHKVSAYVGSGQIGDAVAGERASYAYALSEAERRHNGNALNALRDIGPPPYPASSLWTERLWLNRLEGLLEPRILWNIGRILVRGPEVSAVDVPNLFRGFRFSIDAMWDEASTLDLTRLVPSLTMPVFFFLGRHDHGVPSQVGAAYFDMLSAPSKQLVWFEASGHELFVDEPDKFNASMRELVQPVAG